MADALVSPIRERPPEHLAEMGAHRRLLAYQRGEMNRAELHSWAALYPDEVPLVNGELPWIAVDLRIAADRRRPVQGARRSASVGMSATPSGEASRSTPARVARAGSTAAPRAGLPSASGSGSVPPVTRPTWGRQPKHL